MSAPKSALTSAPEQAGTPVRPVSALVFPRRADLTRAAEPTSVFRRPAVKPRHALAGVTATPARPTTRTILGAIAGAAVVGGLVAGTPATASAGTLSQRVPHLHPGARGTLVVRLQRELSANGRNVPATGYFGNITKERVKELQRRHGWRPTGIAGARVWQVLLSDGHPVSSPSITSYLAGHKKTAPHRAPTTSHQTASSRAAATSSVWGKIAQCESGGNWHINTGNGFYGGLQFSLSTWHGFGGSGLPSSHSRAQQIVVAKRVQRSQGWGAWPTCSARVGLR